MDFISGRSVPHTWAMNELSNTTLTQSRNDSTPNVADCNLDKPLDNTPKQNQLSNTALTQSRNDSTPTVIDCNLDKPLNDTPKHDQLANTAILPVLKA